MMERSLAEPIVHHRAPRRIALVAAVVAASLLAGLGPARGQGGAPRTASAEDPIVARVDGSPVHASEIEQRKARGMAAYTRETGREVPPAFEAFFQRTALEDAVRERLIAKDGRAHGIRVSDAAADSVLRAGEPFQVAGKFDAARFAAYRKDNPRSFARAREEARDFLTFQQRARELEREFALDAATLDALVARRTEKVAVRYALVSETQFDGRTDPSDEELRAYYARHRASFMPPGRVAVTTITFPGLDGGRASAPALARARRSADSLLAAVRAGLPIDSAGTHPGVVPARDSWNQGQERGVFEEAPAWAESAYASPAGRILPRTFAHGDGVSLVRIDRPVPRVVPALATVADDVRARWRAESAAARDRADARRFYDAHPDSFHTPTFVVRYATVDVAAIPIAEPKETELFAWFTARQSEFTRLDPAGGGVRRLEFAEARDEARERWIAERRGAEARRLADESATAWARGKAGPGSRPGFAVDGPITLSEGGALPPGLRPDLADTARAWTSAPRSTVLPDERGFVVVGLLRRNTRERAAFEVVEPRVRAAVERERAEAERAEVRAWFEAHRGRYETGPGYAVTTIHVRPPASSRVDVPGAAIERYYREHPEEFTPAEEVRVRHILFATATRSKTAALELARETRGRLARGEDFATLARRLSDDPSTKEAGGDLGFLRRGATVPAFEEAAFALSAATPYSTPIETNFGIHLIQFVERRGGRVRPFAEVRPALVLKLVAAYADTAARRTAQELFDEVRTRQDLIRIAEERQFTGPLVRWHDGAELIGPAMIDELRADAALVERDQRLPRLYKFRELGYVVAALDSVVPSRPRPFEEVEARVLADFRRDRRLAAAEARAAQVERDAAAGRDWAELTETVGGTPEPVTLGFGEPLPGFGGLAALDSILFGPGALSPGRVQRVTTPRGTLLLSVVERRPGAPDVLAREREAVRRTALSRRVYDHVETLRAGAKIEVLRRELAERPPPPPSL